MKKISNALVGTIAVLVLTLLAPAMVRAAPAFTFSSPGDGTTLVAGNHKFTLWWTFEGMKTDWDRLIDLTYRATSGVDQIEKTLATDIASTGNGLTDDSGFGIYTWDVPASLAMGTYEFRITSSGVTPEVSQTSPEFYVVSGTGTPTITVTSPNGGETLYYDEPYTLTWDTTGTVPRVSISLWDSGGSGKGFLASDIDNTGSYTWTPSESYPLGQYKIRVGGSQYVGGLDGSDELFTLNSRSMPSSNVPTYYDTIARRRPDFEQWVDDSSVNPLTADNWTGAWLYKGSTNPLVLRRLSASGTVDSFTTEIPNREINPELIVRGDSTWLIVGQSTDRVPTRGRALIFDGTEFVDISGRLGDVGCERIWSVAWASDHWILLGDENYESGAELCVMTWDGAIARNVTDTVFGVSGNTATLLPSRQGVRCSDRLCIFQSPNRLQGSGTFIDQVYAYDTATRTAKRFPLPGKSGSSINAVGAPGRFESEWLLTNYAGEAWLYEEVSETLTRYLAMEDALESGDAAFLKLSSGPQILRDALKEQWVLLNPYERRNFAVFEDAGMWARFRATFARDEKFTAYGYEPVTLTDYGILIGGYYAEPKPAPLAGFYVRPRLYEIKLPPLETPDLYTTRQLYRLSDSPDVYVLREGHLYYVPDVATLVARRLIDSTITVVDPSVFKNVPRGFSFLPEGALIRAIGTFDVYIVKYAGEKQFKRLILNPDVFSSYGHLRWEDILDVDPATVDVFPEATLVRVAGTNQIYRLTPNGDVGVRQRISEAKLTAMGLDIESIYEINSTDYDNYTEGDVLE